LKKKGIEFCWDCGETQTCEKWKKHREAGKKGDSFKCYQRLEDDIAFIKKNGVEEFEQTQLIRERFLKEMLREFNDGRSKSYYCIAATVMQIGELEEGLKRAKEKSAGLSLREKSRILHSILDETAGRRNHYLKLRK
jgi:hypothetical protein